MHGTQVFISMLMGGLIDLQARSHGTHMSLAAYFGAGGPLRAHFTLWRQHAGQVSPEMAAQVERFLESKQ